MKLFPLLILLCFFSRANAQDSTNTLAADYLFEAHQFHTAGTAMHVTGALCYGFAFNGYYKSLRFRVAAPDEARQFKRDANGWLAVGIIASTAGIVFNELAFIDIRKAGEHLNKKLTVNIAPTQLGLCFKF